MASVTRSIGTMPYQGGSFVAFQASTGMCRLSPTRMVWMYYQTNPNWMIGSVVDTPGGLALGNTPVLVNNQLLAQRTVPSVGQAPLFVNRLNSNTVIAIQMTSLTSFTYYVYEVDSTTGVLTQVDTGAFTGTAIGNSIVQSYGATNIKVIEHRDNLVQLIYPNTFNGSLTLLQSVKLSYDATAKKITQTAGGVPIGNGFPNTNLPTTSFELIARKVPGRDLTILNARFFYLTSPGLNNGCWSWVLDNNGDVLMPNSSMPNSGSYASASGNNIGELIPLPGDRLVRQNSTNSATFYSIDYTAKTYLPIGIGQFTATFTDQLRHLVPLTADYFASITRNGINVPSASTPVYVKVVRRYDENFIEQSAASALNGNLGFPVVGTPTTVISPTTQIELVDGKLFWWGTDSGGSKLSWTIVGLEPPVV